MLLGDSWGVPNYFGPPGDHWSTHLEYLLKQQGHVVYNCSINGGSNFWSMLRAEDFCKGLEIEHPAKRGFPSLRADKLPVRVDLVIWFHTDMGRDKNQISIHGKSIAEQIEQISDIVYRKFKYLVRQLKSKVVVIGGCTDVHPMISSCMTIDYLIPSWQTLLLGQSSKFANLETGLKTPCENDIKLIDETISVYKAMQQSPLFPDNAHPGAQAHLMLFNLLQAQNLGI